MFRYTVYQIVADISHCWCPMKYAHCFLVKCKSPNISVQFIHIICIYIYIVIIIIIILKYLNMAFSKIFPILRGWFPYSIYSRMKYLYHLYLYIALAKFPTTMATHQGGSDCAPGNLLAQHQSLVRDYPQCSQKTSVVTSLGWEILHHAG